MKYWNLIFIFIGTLFSASGQGFTWQATLPQIKKEGFYAILLTPEVSGRCKEDFSDIRLFDSKGAEVPYFLRREMLKDEKVSFVSYELLEKNSQKGCCTKLILRNPAKNKINNISLMIKNSDVKKNARLSGSDDQQNWFTIKEDFHLESVYSASGSTEVKMLNFPISDYEFYKLDISDSTSAPLNILKAGYYNTNAEEGKFLQLPAPIIRQVDSTNNQSFIFLTFPNPFPIHRIKVVLSGTKYYFRKASLGLMTRQKKTTYFESIAEVDLKSNSENTFNLNQLYAKELCIIIDNKNNTPLKVDSIQALQLSHFIRCNLNQKEKYIIKFGNAALSYPQYDLEYFRDSIPANIDILQLKDITNIALKMTVEKEDFFKSKAWVWSAILVIAALLAFMSWKMMKEIQN